MQYADLGDFLYIIIFLLLMFAGTIEKFIRGKKQQNQPPHAEGLPYEDGEEHPETVVPEPKPFEGKSFEEVVKSILRGEEHDDSSQETVIPQPEKTWMDEMPEEVTRDYQPINHELISSIEEDEIYVSDEIKNVQKEEKETFDFDLREAIIASEILLRKY